MSSMNFTRIKKSQQACLPVQEQEKKARKQKLFARKSFFYAQT